MPIHIAMLRGINVSGHNLIKMEALRESLAELGFHDARTYLQSGNVIFEAGKASTDGLAGKIEKRILADFGLEVPVILRTAGEMEQVVQDNPFVEEAATVDARLYVSFLSAEAPKTAEASLKGLAVNPERLHVHGREVYLYCPNGYGKSKLSNTAVERKLGVIATTRNWKTVNALLALACS